MVNETYEPDPNIILNQIKDKLDYVKKQKKKRQYLTVLTGIAAIVLELGAGYTAHKNTKNSLNNASPQLKRVYEIEKELTQLVAHMPPTNAITEYKKNKEFSAKYDELSQELNNATQKKYVEIERELIRSSMHHETNKLLLYSLLILGGAIVTTIAIDDKYKLKIADMNPKY